jgi:LemA protein
MGTAPTIVVIVVVLLALSYVLSFNRFVRQRNLIAESWQQIDVELARRHDVVPNLVEVVAAYAAHERAVFAAVSAARTGASVLRHSPDREARAAAENQLSTAVRRLVATAEAYPALRADTNFMDLQRRLVDTEDRIAAGRRFYNGNVRAYNTRVRTVPSNVVAAMSGFEAKDFFELRDAATAAVPGVDPAG